jgi:hypothetical protein
MESAAAVAATPDPDVIPKSVFAQRRNVSKGRVSQWISEGKISGAALVGEGRAARIRESVAVAQLRQKLDSNQVAGNGLMTRLDAPAPIAVNVPAAAPPATPTPAASSDESVRDPIEEQIKRERLEQLRRQNRKNAEEEASRAGLLVNAEISQQQFGKIAVQLVTIFDGALSSFAASISARFQVPQRDVLHLLRSDFRKVRGDATAAVRRLAAAMPATVEQELAADSPDESDAAA